MKTEKRAADVGERIVATVDDSCFYDYVKGERGIVVGYGKDAGTIHVITDKRGPGKTPAIFLNDEYEVIIDE